MWDEDSCAAVSLQGVVAMWLNPWIKRMNKRFLQPGSPDVQSDDLAFLFAEVPTNFNAMAVVGFSVVHCLIAA
jgi:hypothetical protein